MLKGLLVSLLSVSVACVLFSISVSIAVYTCMCACACMKNIQFIQRRQEVRSKKQWGTREKLAIFCNCI